MPFDVDATSLRGTWFRHVPSGGDPLFRPQPPGDGRWQSGAVEGFYLADSEETAWAEWYRALAELAVPPMRQLPRDLWRFAVRLARVADLSSEERLARVDLPPPAPDRRQWPDFQSVGEALSRGGWRGVLYPAAARRGALALCVFRHGPDLPGIRPLPPPSRYEEPPVPPRALRT